MNLGSLKTNLAASSQSGIWTKGNNIINMQINNELFFFPDKNSK